MGTLAKAETTIDGRAAAKRLEQRLADGGTFLVLESPVPLGPGEILHAGVEVGCAWYGPADVGYVNQRLLIFGSTAQLAVSAGMSAIGNRRRRRAAADIAAPQWHILGITHVLLTNQQLLVPLDGELRSFPLGTVMDTLQTADRLDIHFTDGTALALEGDWTCYLAVALAAV
jgi:hypothetical protein